MKRHLTAVLIPLLFITSFTSARVEQDENAPIEPSVRIIEGDDRTLEVQEINGVIYAIKVKPKNGPAYFLVDLEGDGNFSRSEAPKLHVPEWVLFKW